MRKKELELHLADGQQCPDLGPIEKHLWALATERELPFGAVAQCAVRHEEFAPALRAVLARAAAGEALSEDEERLLFRGVFILGGARDSQACAPLLRLLQRPPEEVEYLLGDAITEDLSKIVTGVFDGNAEALFGVIADRSPDGFTRDALLGAATFLAFEGRIEGARMRQFLENFHKDRPAPDQDVVWVAWAMAVALLGLRELAPLVHHAFAEERIDMTFITPQDFEQALAEAERAPDDVSRFRKDNLGYIADSLGSLQQYPDEPFESLDQWEAEEHRYLPRQPITNPLRHVGRNDPCPCGSGKKAKKCCLG